MSEALSLKHGKESQALTNPGWDGGSQIEVSSRELDPKVNIWCGDLNLMTLEVEVQMRGL